jgi:dihydrofolate reductase
MAKLIFSAITSLDGYVEDERGNYDWAAPDEEMHSFVNDLERPVGTYLYGRRMYETMVYWETAQALADQPPCAGVHGDMTESRQDRLLQVAGHCVKRQNPHRAQVRPEGDPRDEIHSGT